MLIYLILKKKIEKSNDPAAMLDKIREEVTGIIVELNKTTDRNIALIEDKMNSLMDLLEKADIKISLLRREGEKHEVSKKVYSHIARNKTPEAAEKSLDTRAEVLRMHGSGFSNPLISRRIGITLGEVELIISLNERKR